MSLMLLYIHPVFLQFPQAAVQLIVLSLFTLL